MLLQFDELAAASVVAPTPAVATDAYIVSVSTLVEASCPALLVADTDTFA